MDMSQVQFAPTVSDDIRLAQKMLIGGHAVTGEGYFSEPTVMVNARPLEEYLETKTVVVSL
jgi:hypothetical protein